MNLRTSGLMLALLAPAIAHAQSETDLDDFSLPAGPTATVADEKNALREDRGAPKLGDAVEERRRRRVIKTLQRKTFMKIGRPELGIGPGFVTNDPFINRYIVHLDGTYHVTEVMALQIAGGFSPDLGQSDWKAVTKQLAEQNGVVPDISKISAYGTATIQFSPIYGKVAAPGNKIINFDIFGLFGTGIVQTVDDLEASGSTNNPDAEATRTQIHPTLNYGGGIRAVFTNNIAVRLEGRGLSYIEVVESVNLEMKNNFLLQASFSYFLGKGK